MPLHDPAYVTSAVTVKMALQFPCAAASGSRVTEWMAKEYFLVLPENISSKIQKRKKEIAPFFDSKYLLQRSREEDKDHAVLAKTIQF